MFKERYFGRFYINLKLLESFPDVLMHDLFSSLIIVRAEYLLVQNCIEYTAWGPKWFDLLQEGEAVPYYNAVIELCEIKMKRIK